MTESGLSRRTFLQRSGALGLGIGASGLLGACGTRSKPKSDTKTLVVWDYAATVATAKTYADPLKTWFADAHPGVTLRYQAQPLADYNTIVAAANTSRSGPDIMIVLSGGSGILGRTFQAIATPVNTLLTKADLSSITDQDSFSTTSGDLLAAPQSRLGVALYYNKKLFTRAGLDPENGPKTYDELVRAASTLKAKGIVPIAGGNKEGYLGQFVWSLLLAGILTVDQTEDLSTGAIKFSDDRSVKALSLTHDLVKAGYYSPGFESRTLSDGMNEFINGKAGMYLAGLISDSTSWRDIDPALGTENVGVVAALGVDQSRPLYNPVGGGKGWLIPKYARNQELAVDWMKRSISIEQQSQLFKYGTYPSNSKADFSTAPAPVQALHTAYASGPSGRVGTRTPPTAIAELSRQIAAVLAGDSSPVAAMKAVESTRAAAQ